MSIKPNMGTLDRAIRVGSALLIAALYSTNIISGTVATILGVLAVIFVLTSVIGFCPLYLPFKLSTRKL